MRASSVAHLTSYIQHPSNLCKVSHPFVTSPRLRAPCLCTFVSSQSQSPADTSDWPGCISGTAWTPCRTANNRPATQEIRGVQWNTTVHYCAHNTNTDTEQPKSCARFPYAAERQLHSAQQNTSISTREEWSAKFRVFKCRGTCVLRHVTTIGRENQFGVFAYSRKWVYQLRHVHVSARFPWEAFT